MRPLSHSRTAPGGRLNRRLRHAALAASATIALLQGTAQAAGGAQLTVRDVRQTAPAALLGTWKVDQAASTPPTTPQAIQLRTFQYAEDGKLLVSFINIAADGTQELGNWSLHLDGSAGYERRSDNGSTPIAEIRFRKIDEHRLDLTNTAGGVVAATAVYTLSADGKTLTAVRKAAGGAMTTTVYKRWTGK
jgi:hypothetical protein